MQDAGENVDLVVEYEGSKMTVPVPIAYLSNIGQLRALIASHCQATGDLRIEVFSAKVKQFV
jgi:hypothetical protein